MTIMMLPRRSCLKLMALALPLLPARGALALDAPRGPVELTLVGKLRTPNQGKSAVFDMAMLDKLPQHSIATETPWHTGTHKFTGPLVRDVLAAAGVQGTLLRAVALNDYRVDIPADDVQKFDVVLASKLDDKPMRLRDKGPLFIMYPFHTRPELRDAIYYSRCIWQLKTIEVQ